MADPVTLTIDQQVLVTLQVTDRAGNPASFDAPPVWAASSPALTVQPAADGMSATVISGETVEDAVILTVRGDADLGAGVREIIGSLVFNLTAGEAQFVELQAGAPEAKV
jgi:hypothetical protein